MNEALQDGRRGRGRPKQRGRGLALTVRVHPEELASIDHWVTFNGGGVSRPEALRALAALALQGMLYRRQPA